MFYRTSEYEAAFGALPNTNPEPLRVEVPSEAASPWRRVVRAMSESAKSVVLAYRRRRAHRAALLAIDRLNDHMLRDIGITRADYSALGIDSAFRSSSRMNRWR